MFPGHVPAETIGALSGDAYKARRLMRRSRFTAGHDASGVLVAGALREADPTRGRAGHGWGPRSGFHAMFAFVFDGFWMIFAWEEAPGVPDTPRFMLRVRSTSSRARETPSSCPPGGGTPLSTCPTATRTSPWPAPGTSSRQRPSVWSSLRCSGATPPSPGASGRCCTRSGRSS